MDVMGGFGISCGPGSAQVVWLLLKHGEHHQQEKNYLIEGLVTQRCFLIPS